MRRQPWWERRKRDAVGGRRGPSPDSTYSSSAASSPWTTSQDAENFSSSKFHGRIKVVSHPPHFPPHHLHCLQKTFMETLPLPPGSRIDDEIQTLCQKGELSIALDRLEQLSLPPSDNTFVSLLKTCTKLQTLTQTERVRTFLALHHIHPHGPVGDHLVLAFARCGSLQKAHFIHQSLPSRSAFSWTAMISSLVAHGHHREALAMHQDMVNDGVEPTCQTFAALFKACGNISDLERARKLHADCRIKGFTSMVFVGNILVSTYRKCGSIVEAEEVFGGLPHHNIVSWNSMLAAYVEQGEGEKALLLFRQMDEKNARPNQQTFVIALQACGLLAEAEEAEAGWHWKFSRFKFLSLVQGLHAEAKRNGFDSDTFVGTTLVTLYGKCGTILEAESVSGSMPDQDVVSWTAMLSAYGHQGQGKRALQLYKKMLEEGMNPDAKAFAIAIQACGALAEKEENNGVLDDATKVVALQIVRALHDDAWKKGFSSDPVLGSMLVNIYSKNGSIKEGEDTFYEVPQRDIMAWTALISAYVDHCQGKKALQLYRQMQEEGVRPDHQTFATVLQACGTLAQEEEAVDRGAQSQKMQALDFVQALHADARRRGFVSDSFVRSMLINAYGKCGAIREAEHMFGTVGQPDSMLWFRMLSAYLEQGLGESTLQFFRRMQESGTSPNIHSFLIAIQACGILAMKEETVASEGRSTKVMSSQMGQALLADAQLQGFHTNIFVATAFVNLLGKCGSIEDAETVCIGSSQPDVVLWTAMLSAYVEQGQGERALEVYRQIQDDCLLTLDDITVVCVLQACGRTGSLDICRQLHFAIGFSSHNLNSFLASALAYAYGSCACIKEVQIIFDQLVEVDLVTWNACIAGYAGEGNLLASLESVQEMQLMGCKADGVTFVSLLSACSHVGLVSRGLEFIEALRKEHNLTLDLKHYSTLLDLLGRAGDFKRVKDLLHRMHMQADVTSWLCLLGACRIHGHVELAKHAFDQAVTLQPTETAPYILLSKIYADAGLQDLGDDLRKLRGCKDLTWQELD